jgi:hypothetical protein
MKNLLFSTLIVASLAVGCSKSYTCQCETIASGTGAPAPTTTTNMIEANSKGKAIEACDASESVLTAGGLTLTTNCTLLK